MSGQLDLFNEVGGEATDWKVKKTPAREKIKAAAMQKALANAVDGGSERFNEVALHLLNKGYEVEDCLVGAWCALGIGGRNKKYSVVHVADLLGVSRMTVHRKMVAMAHEIAPLRAQFYEARVADVDEATYRAAVNPRGTAADRTLFYRMAAGALVRSAEPIAAQVSQGVEMGTGVESGAASGWAAALEAAKDS